MSSVVSQPGSGARCLLTVFMECLMSASAKITFSISAAVFS